jgi:hypothetical protein
MIYCEIFDMLVNLKKAGGSDMNVQMINADRFIYVVMAAKNIDPLGKAKEDLLYFLPVLQRVITVHVRNAGQ